MSVVAITTIITSIIASITSLFRGFKIKFCKCFCLHCECECDDKTDSTEQDKPEQDKPKRNSKKIIKRLFSRKKINNNNIEYIDDAKYIDDSTENKTYNI